MNSVHVPSCQAFPDRKPRLLSFSCCEHYSCNFPPQFINTMNTGWRQIRTNERKLQILAVQDLKLQARDGSQRVNQESYKIGEVANTQRQLGGPQNNLTPSLGTSDVVHPAADCGPASCFLGTKVNTKHKNEDQCNAILKESTPSQKITILLEEY